MLTILLFISSFWAVVIWILFQKLNISFTVDNAEENLQKTSLKTTSKTNKWSAETSQPNLKPRGDCVSVPKLGCEPTSLVKQVHEPTHSVKQVHEPDHSVKQKCKSNISERPVNSSPPSDLQRKDANAVSNVLPDVDTNLCSSRVGPVKSSSKRVDRRSASYCVTNRPNSGNVVDGPDVVLQDRGRPISRKRSSKTRSVSPRGNRTNPPPAIGNNFSPKDQQNLCEKYDWSELEEVRGRPVKRESRREKLLRKRRRIISHLKDKDIDELLRVYFFCDKPKEDFEFATPQNINEKVKLPAIKIIKHLERRSSSSTSKRRMSHRNHTGEDDQEHARTVCENGVADHQDHPELKEDKSSSSRNSSPIEGDPDAKQYEVLKFLGHIQMSWRDTDSHIPSFFELDQPRKRSWSLIVYDRSEAKGKTQKSNKIYSKSLEEKVLTKPSIFGTVADDRNPRDNTRRGFPQSQKGTKGGGGYDTDGGHPLPEWAFAQDDDNSLVYEEGVLVSGSLGALVLHATPTPTYYPDAAYLFAFLLSARLFIKPHELLQKICNIGFAQQGLLNEDINTINKEELGNFVPHMVQLLGEWSETFPYDFRDERMMVGVRTLTHRCIALHPTLRRDVTQVLHNLLNKLTQLERHEEALNKLTVPPPADLLPPVPDITEACPSALVLAQQLTHIELERLSYIGPEEFVQAFAKDNLESSYKDLKKTNNLESYVQWFNRLSYLVATQACSPVKKKQRIRVIEMWIEVARECFNIGNFNSLMGVIAGLNMSPVARLKKTWSKVQTAKFSVLEHQMDPSSNFSSYRSTLKAAMWRSAGAVDERQKIVIPFFSLLVKDLYFLNEGCANRLPNGHINFDKFWQLAKQVTEFMAWKQVSCPFEKDPHILHYLQTTPVLSETGLALASFESEGPENNYEKERFKTLKSETQPPPN